MLQPQNGREPPPNKQHPQHFPFSNNDDNNALLLLPSTNNYCRNSASSSSTNTVVWQMQKAERRNSNGGNHHVMTANAMVGRKAAHKQSQSGEPHTNLRLVMVGSGGVGKSALTIQFVQQYFVHDYDPTIADAYTKSCFVDDALYKVEVLDTAGQEEYASMRDQHLRSGDGFLLVFSVTNRQSLEYVLRLRRIIERLKDRDHFPMILVGNKTDLEMQRQVSQAEAEELAQHLQIPYLESSAKFRQNVDQIFHSLIRQIRQFRWLERRCNGRLEGQQRERDETDQQRKQHKKEERKAKKKKDKNCRIQ